MTTVKFKHGMVAPLVALFVGVVGFPLGYAFYLSITDYKLTSHGTPKLVGADNYVATLRRRRVLAGVRHHRDVRVRGGRIGAADRPGDRAGTAEAALGKGSHAVDAAGADVHHADRGRADLPLPAQRSDRRHPAPAAVPSASTTTSSVPARRCSRWPSSMSGSGRRSWCCCCSPGWSPSPGNRWRRPGSTARAAGTCCGG